MDFDALWVLAAIWFVFNLISGVRRKPGSPTPPKQPWPRSPERPGRVSVDPTQQEGSRLERMLRELQQSLEESAQARQPEPVMFPSAEEVEERTSLEEVPEIRSLEEEVRRAPRELVDRDDEAASFEARRIAAAAARDHARTKADHAEFDERIRQEPADHTATRGFTPEQLRNAIIWREILGPPVSER
ncbi:MAG TPA: hypothetical protein VHH32_07795 [Gemmatimonadales bacterium]|nr:hypothetical protein [Gemmatimonadales bacterium]